ncbi:hypothetical protein FZC35_02270 [Candidatus Cytomitobacter indipagum]|uniref:phosphoribosylaminoimidazolesuccinocarboxamide synthase n=1 Tax=Candidatus Cytomitobacter indipagum TaxID=2601575 RepID=A0A5C0UGM6_9PROT|nr:phosphoribosylaminoimidazolesuccinocarboxamide synthase [Candidatus Cytomitobacter indipagum]QEK38184.1 hypothetical protein FZC35_02270 [Candidatus Cytomitobacter indipagum]
MYVDSGSLGQRKLIYSGTTKKIYGASKDTLVIHYPQNLQNDVWRNYASSMIWKYLSGMGIKNHFIQRLSLREQLVKTAETYSVFVKVYNIVSREMHERLGIEEGTCFHKPLLEWHLKSKELGNPVISLGHIRHFEWLKEEQIVEMESVATRANDVLQAYFYCNNMRLGDVVLEFGKIDGNIVLIDEISPETCNFWNVEAIEMLQKDEVYKNMKNMNKFT